MKNTNESKVLVAYFSVKGSTKRTAQIIAQTLGATLFEIRPEQAYTQQDMNFCDPESRSSKEMIAQTLRPAIVGPMPDPTTFDVLYIGYPIWWDYAPSAVYTFIESCDLQGKTVVPFAVSAASDIGDVQSYLGKLLPQSATLKKGKRFSNTASDSTIKRWAGWQRRFG